MKGACVLLCLMLARDIAGSIFRPQYNPRMANLVVQPLELLRDQEGIERHQRQQNRHQHPRRGVVNSDTSRSDENKDKDKATVYDATSDYYRSPIHAWNSDLYATVIGQTDERQNYDDVSHWKSKQIAEVPTYSVTNEKDLERSIFYDAFKTMKHMNDEEKKRFHEAYQTAVQTSKEDVRLNAPQLLKKNHYEVEEHTVKTDDGYVLTLFRIPAKENWDKERSREDSKEHSKESHEHSKEHSKESHEHSKESKENKESKESKEHSKESREHSKESKESKEHSKESREHSKESKESKEHSKESREHSKEHSKESKEHSKESKEHSKESKEHSKEHSREHSKEDSKEHSKEDSKERSKEDSKERSKEHSREDSKERSKEHSKEHSREDSKERSREDSKEHSKEHRSDAHKAPVVFLMHGLQGSADDWLLMGPGKSLAYLLADAGFDVWLGNARGNKYSRRHVSKHPAQPEFWQFTTDEIALHDLPAMIDYALNRTKQEKLVYVGHSQGTTAFFALVSSRPQYNHKIKMMYAISPMVYMENARSPLLRMIAANYRINGDLKDNLFGQGEFNPNKMLIQLAGGNMCEYEIGCKDVCSNVHFIMAGVNPEDVSRIPVIMSHLPAGSSIRQVKHFGQAVATHEFRKYDYGAEINEQMYGQREPPKYDITKVKVPVALYYSEKDWLAHPEDVERLRHELRNVQDAYKVPDTEFTHMDFQFSKKAPEIVYKRLIKSIEKTRK